jgi:hypothetical protein
MSKVIPGADLDQILKKKMRAFLEYLNFICNDTVNRKKYASTAA